METTINGITFENVTAEEALVLSGFNQKKSTTSPAVVSEAPVKRAYTKRSTKVVRLTMVEWTVPEIEYVLSNPGMKPKEIQKILNRHTKPAVQTMTSAIRNRRFTSISKKNRKIINAFYNSDKSKADSFAESFKIPVKVQSE